MAVVGIVGSLRSRSVNRLLLAAFGGELAPLDQIVTFEGLAQIPHYSQDRDGAEPPLEARRLREAISTASALVIATPEYNGSVPGVLKNALDWASRPWPENALRGKPVLVLGASTGIFGALRAQAELRRILTLSGANVLRFELSVGQADRLFEPDGRLTDGVIRAALREGAAQLIRASAQNMVPPMPRTDRGRCLPLPSASAADGQRRRSGPPTATPPHGRLNTY